MEFLSFLCKDREWRTGVGLWLPPFICFFVSVLFWSSSGFSFQIPALTEPVVDEAQVFDPNIRDRLSLVLKNLYQQKKTQIQILTVSSLDGTPIEQASIQVAEAWKLGTQKEDRGILILMSSKDRKIRIEVGQGLEGDIPDIRAKRIIADIIVPYFKQGQFQTGLLVGVSELVRLSDPDFDFKGAFENDLITSQLKNQGKSGLIFFLLVLFLLLFINRFGGGRGLRSAAWGMGGGMVGGGFGRGGSGGWGGGGGGFSGGGASGDW